MDTTTFAGIAVGEARRNLGHPYRDSSVPTNWPPEQFDCSTFTHWCYSRAGVNIDQATRDSTWPQREPRPWRKYEGYTMSQVTALGGAGCRVAFGERQAGDLLYYTGGTAGVGSSGHHVVMYVGSGRVVHAAGTKYGVIESNVVPPGIEGHGGKHFIAAMRPSILAVRLGVASKPVPSLEKAIVVIGGRSDMTAEQIRADLRMSRARFDAHVRLATPVGLAKVYPTGNKAGWRLQVPLDVADNPVHAGR